MALGALGAADCSGNPLGRQVTGDVNGTMAARVGARNEVMCANAAAAGYDSIKFVRHTCNMMYGQCRDASKPALNYWNIEVVSTRLVGFHPCGSSDGVSPLIRSGWQGSDACSCNNSRAFINCAEVPPAGRVAKQH